MDLDCSVQHHTNRHADEDNLEDKRNHSHKYGGNYKKLAVFLDKLRSYHVSININHYETRHNNDPDHEHSDHNKPDDHNRGDVNLHGHFLDHGSGDHNYFDNRNRTNLNSHGDGHRNLGRNY